MPQVLSEDQCQQAYRWASHGAQNHAAMLQVALFVSGSFVCTFRTPKGHWQTGQVAMGCDYNIQRDRCSRICGALDQQCKTITIILKLPIFHSSEICTSGLDGVATPHLQPARAEVCGMLAFEHEVGVWDWSHMLRGFLQHLQEMLFRRYLWHCIKQQGMVSLSHEKLLYSGSSSSG